jgi:tetratricopeptide (TPR) repeat protein
VEASKTPERALPSAMRLGGLMPGAGHLVHMPSHIFLRLGDYEQSADVNVKASEVDRQYIARAGKGMYALMYYSHNLHFVSYVRGMQGRFDDAMDYAKLLRENVTGAIDGMPMAAPYGAFEWIIFNRFQKYRELLAMPAPKEKSTFLNAMYRYSRGVAFAGLGQVKEADAERERMGALVKTLTETDMLMINPASAVLAVGLEDLDGRIARAKGQKAEEVSHLQKSVELQDKLAYMEPPEWHQPQREALGAALLRQGKAAEAEAIFRRELELNPRNGRVLFGLFEALKKQDKTVNADWVRKEFDDAWKSAQIQLRIDDL